GCPHASATSTLIGIPIVEHTPTHEARPSAQPYPRPGWQVNKPGSAEPVNDFVDLVATQLAADLRAAPQAIWRRFSDEGRAQRCNTIEDLRVMAKRTVPQ